MMKEKTSLWWGPPKKFDPSIASRKISWLELFYDLIYVIAISRTTHLFAEHPGPSGLMDYSYLFTMIFWGWLNGSIYHDLHGSPGIRTRLMTLWQMMTLAALVVCLGGPPDTVAFRATLALMVMQVFITYLWWSVGIYDKAHRVYNRPYTVCFLFTTLLLGCTLYMHYPWTKIISWVALVFNFVPPFLVIRKLKNRNSDFSLSANMVERLGLFTIIVFGECVLGVINSAMQVQEMNLQSWLNFGLGILIVFALWWIFFSIIADRESQGGFLNANLIELTYLLTLASLGIIGASFPGLIQHYENTTVDAGPVIKTYFGGALFIFLFGMVLLSYLLEFPEAFHYAKKPMRRLLFITGSVIALITFFLPGMGLTTYLLTVFVLLVLIIVAGTKIWFAVQIRGGQES